MNRFDNDFIQKINGATTSDATNSNTPSWYDGKKFLHYVLGRHMLEHSHITRINGILHIYDKTSGLYCADTDVFENAISDFQDTLVQRQIDEVFGYIRRKSIHCKSELAPARYIAFNNGIIDLEADTLQLQPFSPDIVLTHKLGIDFVNPFSVPNNEDNIAFVHKFFHTITGGDTELITLLDELNCYCCYRGSEYHSFYLFSGAGGNGKSSYFKVVNAIVGSLCMNINLKELTSEKFAPANLVGITCNISSDETALHNLDTGNLKRLTGGDTVSVDKKNIADRITFSPVATFLISMNKPISFNDTTNGFARRVRVIPFRNKFKVDTAFERRLLSPEILQIIAYRAIVAFKKVLQRGNLTYPSCVKSATDKYLSDNNPIGNFSKWFMNNPRPCNL